MCACLCVNECDVFVLVHVNVSFEKENDFYHVRYLILTHMEYIEEIPCFILGFLGKLLIFLETICSLRPRLH